MATDPVCGMQVDENEAKWTAEHDGKTYYFCSPGCLKAFEASPEQYVQGSEDAGGHMHHHS